MLAIFRRLSFLTLYILSFLFFIGNIIKNIRIPQYYVYVVKIDTTLLTTLLSLVS